MRCKACGAVNPDWMPNQSEDMLRFCVKCGSALASAQEDAADTAEDAAAAAKAAVAAAAASAAVASARPAALSKRSMASSGSRSFSGDLAPTAEPEASGVSRTGAPARPARSASERAETKPAVTTHKTAPPPKPKKHAGWIAAAVIAVIVLVLGYSQFHIWEPATCTEPEKCKICGETRGEANGHDWVTEYCLDASVCSVCGATHAPFGHDWAEATYDAPKTCRRCGFATGGFKGEIPIGNPCGWSDEQIDLDGWNVHYLRYDQMISNCNLLTIRFGFKEAADSELYGDWKVYVRTSDGQWSRVGIVRVDADSFVEHTNDVPTYTIEITPGVSFDAITTIPTWEEGQFSGSTLWISRAQTYQ